MKRKYVWKCPISRVSKDCGYCLQDGWQHCGYVKAWKHRKQVSTSSPYEPLTINSPVVNKKSENEKE